MLLLGELQPPVVPTLRKEMNRNMTSPTSLRVVGQRSSKRLKEQLKFLERELKKTLEYVRKLKQSIARIKTVLRQRELGG